MLSLIYGTNEELSAVFNHTDKISMIHYNLFNKVKQSIKYQKQILEIFAVNNGTDITNSSLINIDDNDNQNNFVETNQCYQNYTNDFIKELLQQFLIKYDD